MLENLLVQLAIGGPAIRWSLNRRRSWGWGFGVFGALLIALAPVMYKFCAERNMNHYDTLGVPYSASKQQLQSAFRQKSRHVHPDRNPDPEAVKVFDDLSMALDVLQNKTKRYNYDRFGDFSVKGLVGADDVVGVLAFVTSQFKGPFLWGAIYTNFGSRGPHLKLQERIAQELFFFYLLAILAIELLIRFQASGVLSPLSIGLGYTWPCILPFEFSAIVHRAVSASLNLSLSIGTVIEAETLNGIEESLTSLDGRSTTTNHRWDVASTWQKSIVAEPLLSVVENNCGALITDKYFALEKVATLPSVVKLHQQAIGGTPLVKNRCFHGLTAPEEYVHIYNTVLQASGLAGRHFIDALDLQNTTFSRSWVKMIIQEQAARKARNLLWRRFSSPAVVAVVAVVVLRALST